MKLIKVPLSKSTILTKLSCKNRRGWGVKAPENKKRKREEDEEGEEGDIGESKI